MPLIKLSDNEVLGDAAAHFFKSGNILRSADNHAVEALLEHIPETGPCGTRVEYDIWYSIDDGDRVHGYCYTDVLTRFLYFRVARAHYANQVMLEACHHPITPEGKRLFDEMADDSSDKYKLRPMSGSFSFVIFLPGTNIFHDTVDIAKLKRAVDQGAYLKPHPITAPSLIQFLKNTFGKDKIIERRESGHELLNQAAIVGCCKNSEMGISALAKGKTVYLFDKPSPHRTYTSIYKALSDGDRLVRSRLRNILSAPYTGLVSASSENAEARIAAFFDHYKDLEHVPPKNSDT